MPARAPLVAPRRAPSNLEAPQKDMSYQVAIWQGDLGMTSYERIKLGVRDILRGAEFTYTKETNGTLRTRGYKIFFLRKFIMSHFADDLAGYSLERRKVDLIFVRTSDASPPPRHRDVARGLRSGPRKQVSSATPCIARTAPRPGPSRAAQPPDLQHRRSAPSFGSPRFAPTRRGGPTPKAGAKPPPWKSSDTAALSP